MQSILAPVQWRAVGSKTPKLAKCNAIHFDAPRAIVNGEDIVCVMSRIRCRPGRPGAYFTAPTSPSAVNNPAKAASRLVQRFNALKLLRLGLECEAASRTARVKKATVAVHAVRWARRAPQTGLPPGVRSVSIVGHRIAAAVLAPAAAGVLRKGCRMPLAIVLWSTREPRSRHTVRAGAHLRTVWDGLRREIQDLDHVWSGGLDPIRIATMALKGPNGPDEPARATETERVQNGQCRIGDGPSLSVWGGARVGGRLTFCGIQVPAQESLATKSQMTSRCHPEVI
jgi:hypothetical protein